MTIAEHLYISDRETFMKIILAYQLDEISKMFFPPKIVPSTDVDYSRLMMPGSYSGKAERRRGAIVQKYRKILK